MYNKECFDKAKQITRNYCFSSGIDLESLFKSYDKTNCGSITKNAFLKVFSDTKIPLKQNEVDSLSNCYLQNDELVKYESFIELLVYSKPNDYIDPELSFAILPQPYRRIVKVLDDILDSTWNEIHQRTFKKKEKKSLPEIKSKELLTFNSLSDSDLNQISFLTVNTPGNRILAASSRGELYYIDFSSGTILASFSSLFATDYTTMHLSNLLGEPHEDIPSIFAICGVKRNNSSDINEEDKRTTLYNTSSIFICQISNINLKLNVIYTLELEEEVLSAHISLDRLKIRIIFRNGSLRVFSIGVNTSSQIKLQIQLREQLIYIPALQNSKYIWGEFLVNSSPSKAHLQLPVVDQIAIWRSLSNQLMIYKLSSLIEQQKADENSKKNQLDTSTVPSLYIKSWLFPSAICCSALDSSTKLIALGLDNGNVIIWNLQLGIEARILELHSSPVNQIAFYQNRYVVANAINHRIHFYDILAQVLIVEEISPLITNTLITEIILDTGKIVSNLICLNDLPLVVVTLADRTIEIYDLLNGEQLGCLHTSSLSLKVKKSFQNEASYAILCASGKELIVIVEDPVNRLAVFSIESLLSRDYQNSFFMTNKSNQSISKEKINSFFNQYFVVPTSSKVRNKNQISAAIRLSTPTEMIASMLLLNQQGKKEREIRCKRIQNINDLQIC